MAKQEIRTRPDGTRYPITPKKGGGAKLFVGAVALVTVVGSGTAVGSGVAGLGGAGMEAGSAAEALPGNLSGEVADSLPGRSLKTRTSEGRKSAQRGRKSETFGRFKLKQLDQAVKHEAQCLAASTDRVREYLARHRCTSLDRGLYAVGDGHGDAAAISLVRVRFPKKSDATGCEKVEKIQGSGDVKPLGSAALGLAGLSFSGHHYRSRIDRRTLVIAEVETITGHLDAGTLDALADVSVWFPGA
ncbi:hypothetical protein [Amycolatopsis jiangsuensis]|uniref:Uncharacterized protein n=1 Tax=Amycolatopsis jiangsuensis TaxID=1181879 RepID=A0A840J235_9PSEU|nr:hypothetical protein [Amycolatopsis jiangsuensis]MBB4687963.1 hypothetical protein [Amycolatopsis jiangsuensis]